MIKKLSPGLILKVITKFIAAFGFYHGIRLIIGLKKNKENIVNLPGIVHPFKLRKEISDLNVFYQVFVDSDDKYLNQIDNPTVIIDAGANIGLNTIKFKNKFPNAQIISIEPDPENYQTLLENTKGYSNIFCEQCGLWNRNANLKISDKFKMGKWAMIVEETEDEQNIKGRTLQSIMDQYNLSSIDLLKIDIESSEKQLFSENYSFWLAKTKVIVIELHDQMTQGCAHSFFNAILNTFKEFKYSHSDEYTIVVNTSKIAN